MIKGMIAGLTALSISVTPVQAQELDETQLVQLFAGLLAAGVLTKAMSDNRDVDAHAAPVVHDPEPYEPSLLDHQPRFNPNYEPPVVKRRGLNPDRDRRARNPNGWPNRYSPRDYGGLRDPAMELPSNCAREIETRYGTVRMFVRRCLERTFARVDRLPRRCEVRVMSMSGPRNGYDSYCLRENGYRISRR